MPEVAPAGEKHRDTVFIGGLDDLIIPHRASGLDDRYGPRFDRGIEPVPERKEGVRRADGARGALAGTASGELS